jgi:hypothetical protein
MMSDRSSLSFFCFLVLDAKGGEGLVSSCIYLVIVFEPRMLD